MVLFTFSIVNLLLITFKIVYYIILNSRIGDFSLNMEIKMAGRRSGTEAEPFQIPRCFASYFWAKCAMIAARNTSINQGATLADIVVKLNEVCSVCETHCRGGGEIEKETLSFLLDGKPHKSSIAKCTLKGIGKALGLDRCEDIIDTVKRLNAIEQNIVSIAETTNIATTMYSARLMKPWGTIKDNDRFLDNITEESVMVWFNTPLGAVSGMDGFDKWLRKALDLDNIKEIHFILSNATNNNKQIPRKTVIELLEHSVTARIKKWANHNGYCSDMSALPSSESGEIHIYNDSRTIDKKVIWMFCDLTYNFSPSFKLIFAKTSLNRIPARAQIFLRTRLRRCKPFQGLDIDISNMPIDEKSFLQARNVHFPHSILQIDVSGDDREHQAIVDTLMDAYDDYING